MSSFFTRPASEKKRKRPESNGVLPSRKRRENAGPPAKKKAQSRAAARDESISGSDSEDNVSNPELTPDDGASESSEHENETAAEKRMRLAEGYLQNLKDQIDEDGFDAADLDRDLIAERLKEDVSESKGRLYRFIASSYDFSQALATQFRMSTGDCVTAIAVCQPYIYSATRGRTITKWELPPAPSEESSGESPTERPLPRRPKKVASSKGLLSESSNPGYKHHTSSILSLAVSQNGQFVVTGGADKKLIVWSAEDLTPLRVFTQHRGPVLSLAFRRGTNQLYSGSADRTIKTWSLNELAYVETLFGHQNHITDVAALSQERCLSAGSRDRSVRLWKVVDETQLVFQNGDGNSTKLRQGANTNGQDTSPTAEGSLDCITFIDDETFISGSDNGNLSLWSVSKKKPLFTLSAAHGFDPPPKLDEAFADIDLAGKSVPGRPEARWITALVALPYSDLFVSGSWDGYIRAWKISSDKKRIESLGPLGPLGRGSGGGQALSKTGENPQSTSARGVVNDLDIFERGSKGREKIYVVAALGKEHRLGRWRKVAGGKSGAVIFEIDVKKSPELEAVLENQNSEMAGIA